ncbi:MAG: hypothetical protein C0449_16020 [Polaromonas sp.]|jgi:hypothetical protein|nr:hypothetical protein [Polaromonas sp.]
MPPHQPARTYNSAFNTGFREWLRKVTSTTDDATKLACEQLRLEQVKKLIGDLLGAHVSDMSARDLRVYLRIVLASQIDSIREVRFECFDLMCRKISEPVAVRQLQTLDTLIA